jgi:flagellar hook-basal body complex protein FliE
MSQIPKLRFEVGQTHLQTAARIHEKFSEASIRPAADAPGFAERLGAGLRDVADAQNSASEMARNYELGLENDLAKVMISQQVSSLGFQLTLSLRNKALSAYKDIMNMPV